MLSLANTSRSAHRASAAVHRRITAAPAAVAARHGAAPCACGGGCPRCHAVSADSGALDATLKLDGVPAIADYEEAGDVVAIDAPIAPIPTPSPVRGPPSSGAAAAPTCPKNISVAEILHVELSAANVAQGFHTGMGGIAMMEVSDPSGRDWAGTTIHENVASGTNTCQPGTAACSNAQGQGGAAGSTFTVGDGVNALGVSLPAQHNCFYDFHIFGQQGPSLLHQQNLPSCEHSCQQLYDCGGRIFGPTFTIHRTMMRDHLVVGGTPVDVTRVDLDKPQNPSPPGDYPAPNLPPGTAYA